MKQKKLFRMPFRSQDEKIENIFAIHVFKKVMGICSDLEKSFIQAHVHWYCEYERAIKEILFHFLDREKKKGARVHYLTDREKEALIGLYLDRIHHVTIIKAMNEALPSLRYNQKPINSFRIFLPKIRAITKGGVDWALGTEKPTWKFDEFVEFQERLENDGAVGFEFDPWFGIKRVSE